MKNIIIKSRREKKDKKLPTTTTPYDQLAIRILFLCKHPGWAVIVFIIKTKHFFSLNLNEKKNIIFFIENELNQSNVIIKFHFHLNRNSVYLFWRKKTWNWTWNSNWLDDDDRFWKKNCQEKWIKNWKILFEEKKWQNFQTNIPCIRMIWHDDGQSIDGRRQSKTTLSSPTIIIGSQYLNTT